MGAVGDKYVLTLKSEDATQDPSNTNPMFNVFAYEAVSGVPDANDLFLVFTDEVVPLIQLVIGDTTEMIRCDVINLDDPADFDLNGLSAAGSRGGDKLPMFNTWTFTYNRAVRGIHNGRKAFGTIAEGDQENGQPSSTIITPLVNLAIKLGSQLVGTNGNYIPRIWRRAGTYKVAGVPTVFPDTYYPIAGVNFTDISTQNSRKR